MIPIWLSMEAAVSTMELYHSDTNQPTMEWLKWQARSGTIAEQSLGQLIRIQLIDTRRVSLHKLNTYCSICVKPASRMRANASKMCARICQSFIQWRVIILSVNSARYRKEWCNNGPHFRWESPKLDRLPAVFNWWLMIQAHVGRKSAYITCLFIKLTKKRSLKKPQKFVYLNQKQQQQQE